ncbi:hypothetical protein ABPG72_019993 [Tetrahymena utriculariae]
MIRLYSFVYNLALSADIPKDDIPQTAELIFLLFSSCFQQQSKQVNSEILSIEKIIGNESNEINHENTQNRQQKNKIIDQIIPQKKENLITQISDQSHQELIEEEEYEQVWEKYSLIQKIIFKITHSNAFKSFKWPLILDGKNLKFVHRTNIKQGVLCL